VLPLPAGYLLVQNLPLVSEVMLVELTSWEMQKAQQVFGRRHEFLRLLQYGHRHLAALHLLLRQVSVHLRRS
jgi:hypothetical protein